MEKRTILIQIDTDQHPSVFDRVVAVDAGVDELFSYGGVQPADVQGLVHGAIFTRKLDDLKRTAIFIGGSNVDAAEALVAEARKSMIPPANLQVSVLMDANGCNTTASAAVLAAGQHLELGTTKAIVLGGTGPVGQRVARLLARQGATVRVASRKQDRAVGVCEAVKARVEGAMLEPVGVGSPEDLRAAMQGQQLVVAAGAAGITLLPEVARKQASDLKVAIDLNAVPPLGIEGVGVTDKAKEIDGIIGYGAIGVGGTKMKIHRAAIARLFQANNQVMDAEEVYAIGVES
ncbi:MAG: NADP-dependent methylenetetrahydromethanopterin/methylenetetrahydrofolate dehydrogenase [Gemmataceae bacterium]